MEGIATLDLSHYKKSRVANCELTGKRWSAILLGKYDLVVGAMVEFVEVLGVMGSIE